MIMVCDIVLLIVVQGTQSANPHNDYLRALVCDIVLLIVVQGTQSANPHNDYCQHFVDTGERPQNFIRDVGSLSVHNNNNN